MARKKFLAAAFVVGMVPAAFAQLSSADKAFAARAAQIDDYQIEASLLVNKYSSHAAYRQYATMLANDRTEDSGQLQSTVADEDPSFRLPSGVSPADKRQLDALKNTRNLDMTFRGQIISSEASTLKLYQDYIERRRANPELKHMAQQLLPKYQQQLEDARNLEPPAR